MRSAIITLALLATSTASEPTVKNDIDFNKLRQLIEQSRGQQKQPTPDEQRVAKITQLQIDRSPAGILNARLEEAREKPTPPDTPPDLELEVKRFGRDITLSRWEKVRDYLATLPENTRLKTYQLVLAKLSAPVAVNPQPDLLAQGAKPHTQRAFLPPADFLGLAAAAPAPPDTETLAALAKILPTEPRPPDGFFEALEAGIPHLGGTDPADRLRAAELLIQAGEIEAATPFLPAPEAAREAADHAAINLVARHRAELFRRDEQAAGDEALATAWQLSNLLISDAEAPPPARAEALFRALSLIPELGEKDGGDWLATTFGESSGGGLEILATLGSITAQSQENPDPEIRLAQLELQHAAAGALLATPGLDPDKWRELLTLYARQWTHEADVTRVKDQSSSRRMVPQYDNYGNLFYSQPTVTYHGDGTRPIPAASLIDCRPGGEWLTFVEPTVRIETLSGAARLFLKVKEEANALPLVDELSATHPELATDLVRETIRVWAENHNPNDEQDHRSRYFYFYGFDNRAGSIPLTRSKQERNLVELAGLVRKIRELGLDESFHEELADAFISSHSQAEVWRVEAIETVFGKSDTLDGATIATLVERMRLNLAGLWPDPKLQQAYQTKRKDKELQQQIFHGYQAATGLIETALAGEPDITWRLETQLAALRFEESNYRSSIEPDTGHSATVRRALDGLAAAAASYTATLPAADPDDETSAPFETWFFAALGSPSLEALKAHHQPTTAEFGKIKAALDALPEEAAGRHLEKFANTLNNRLANVSPALKLRYLEGADAIVGDHPTFADAAEVLAYYRDLTTEIELDATLDGPDTVSAGTPFGLKVNIRHTREIEREAGGFQRYLQNQTGSQYAYNFGRPPEDYRDKFEKAARAALEETFEVVSVTFHSEKVESRTDPEFGWRLTPYAYLLLKARGPQIDRIPPLSIDLDFQDTSGYVVLPVASAEIPIDASGTPVPRPFRDLRLTQTLDTRSLQETGSVFLEINATAHGLVPALDSLVALPADGFDLGEIEDRQLLLSELDAASDDLAPLSQHEWRLELKPTGGTPPATFRFPVAKVETADDDGLILQRYDDVDLLPVAAEVPLDGATRRPIIWIIAGLPLLAALIFIAIRLRRKPVEPPAKLRPLPARLTPVTLLGWLQRLREHPGLPPELRAELDQEILTLEAGHFAPGASPLADQALQQIALRWQAAA